MTDRLTKEQWSDYWRAGTLTSFHGHFEQGYDGEIRAFWFERFAELPSEARILDLATGNGALAALALEYSHLHRRHFQIVGIDSAQIHSSLKKYATLRLISSCRMESTGLEDNQFDLIMSQFGLEYGQRESTVQEIYRLLKPGATLAVLLHHKQSAVLTQAREALQATKRWQNAGLEDTGRRLVQLQQILERNGHLTVTQQKQAQTLHQHLTSQIKRMQSYARQLKDPAHIQFMLHQLSNIFDRRHAKLFSPTERLQKLNLLQQANSAYRLRMKDLYNAALSDEDLARLIDALRARHFTVQAESPLLYQNQRFAHTLVAKLDKNH